MAQIFPATSMPDRDWWAALWPSPADIIGRLGIQPEMNVLDLCCGNGYFTAPLARHVAGKVWAIDIDPHMIECAKAEVKRTGATVRQWICADAREAASLVAKPMDYVLMANTFHGVPDQTALATTVRQILRPNGLFAIVNWLPRPRHETVVLGKPRGPATEMRMSPEAVRAVMEPTGFALASFVDLPPYHYGSIFKRTV